MAGHLEHVGTLYAMLDEKPERANACLAALFSDVTKERGDVLDDRERGLVETLGHDLSEAAKVLQVDEKDLYTTNELSHLVFDPFPARLTVRPGGAVSEVEGFAAQPDGSLLVPGLGIWEAYEALGGRFAAPDLLGVYITARRAGTRDLDVAALAATPRRVTRMDAPAVRAELLRFLMPAPVYRVSFAVKPPSEDELGFNWAQVSCP